MSPVTAITTCLAKSFTYRGRAGRSEFWWFQALRIVVAIAFLVTFSLLLAETFKYNGEASGFDDFADAAASYGTAVILMSALVLILLPASYSSSVRRLHDRGHPGWPLWLVFVAALSQFYIYLALLIYVLHDPYAGLAIVEAWVDRIDSYFTDPGSIEAFLDSGQGMIAINLAYFVISIIIGCLIIGPFYFIFFSIQACLPSNPDESRHGPVPNTLSQNEVFQ